MKEFCKAFKAQIDEFKKKGSRFEQPELKVILNGRSSFKDKKLYTKVALHQMTQLQN